MPDTPKLKRWLIEGQITTLTPLHIGDGSTFTRKGSEQEIAQVARDANGNPYLPGSSLRGFLRTNFENCFDESRVKDLFGYQALKPVGTNAESKGGLLSVWDAFSSQRIETQVQHHVVINRQTRTAAEHLLFTQEVVPANSKFSVTLVVEGLNASRDHVQQLSAVLNQFDSGGERLGAGTADNLGRVRWSLSAVRELNLAAIDKWLAKGGLLNSHLDKINLTPVALKKSSRWLRLTLSLQFQEKFLVKDAETSKNVQRNRNLNASPIEARRTAKDLALLDATSFSGAMRSQCERIARTIAGPHADQWVRNVEDRASAPQNIKDYTAVDCLFGGVGWLSPIQVDDEFVAVEAKPPTLQEFLAIDRFTGGGVEGLKYDANGFEQPLIKGRLKLDLKKLALLKSRNANPPVFPDNNGSLADLWVLLGLTFRDLAEGDIRFGFGASKGYGACRVSFQWEDGTACSPQSLVDTLNNLNPEEFSHAG